MSYNTRECFWFGTEERSGWFRTPLQGAESSPQDWSAGGSLINGGGWQLNSWGSHKSYQYEWGSSTPIEWAQLMKSYADGTHGRGLLYFYDPLTMARNVLPARWADPSMALGDEGAGLVYGVDPTPVVTPEPNPNWYPLLSATYDLSLVTSGFRGREDAVYLPIPAGYTLCLGARYTATGTGGVFVTSSNRGVLGVTTKLTSVAHTGDVVNTLIDSDPNQSGVWLSIGKSSSGASSVTVSGMVARVVKTVPVLPDDLGYGLEEYGETPYGGYAPTGGYPLSGPWTAGMGHSGARFIGKPTFESNTPLNGGQVGFAASFREVGSWAY